MTKQYKNYVNGEWKLSQEEITIYAPATGEELGSVPAMSQEEVDYVYASAKAAQIDFDKIVITADQDSDGMAIELLLITFFYTYMRPLVEQGKLYRAVTPLYIVRYGKEELYFYTEEEMDNFKATHKSGYDILRAKGLGELNAEDLHKVCFKDQRFKRITISDAEKTKILLDTLQGQAVAPRKQFIYDNAERLGFDFD